MFAKPRQKKSILPHPNRRRKNTSAVEEVTFDHDARQEYLTGFHKRKQQRIKHAQDAAAKRAKAEKIETRKQIRDDRKRELEEHVEHVNRVLRESNAAVDKIHNGTEEDSDKESEGWDGFPDQPDLNIVDHEEEYVEEDRYTTVTIESVSISRDGFSTPAQIQQAHEEEVERKRKSIEAANAVKAALAEKRAKQLEKPKKKQFRYEPKIDRMIANERQRQKKKGRRRD